mmetsp:Transcript_19374/g.48245  ORF Transcript_19374/g.48245 Transcript_19374/m.48245 type:complete len:475 (-) Transcript_19374:249-1673(-)
MISINDDVSLVLCDKPVVKRGKDIPPLKYVTTTVTTPSVSKSFESNETVVDDETENETVPSLSRTNPCTYSMVVTVHKTDKIVLVPKVRNSEEQKTITIIAQKALTTQRRSLLLSTHCPRKSQNKKDTKTIVFTLAIDDGKESTTIDIALDADKAKMMRLAMINDRYWLVKSASSSETDDDKTPSPPKIQTPLKIHSTSELQTFKKGYNVVLGQEESVGFMPLFPESGKILDEIEGLEEEEEKASVMVENAKTFLEDIKQDVSQDDDDKEEDKSASDTSSTHDSINEHSTTPPGAYTVGGGWQDFQVAAGNFGEDDDNSSPDTSTTASLTIASSPSSATFKTFDDMSILTDDNTLYDFEIDDANGNFKSFEDMSVMTGYIPEKEENEFRVSYSSEGFRCQCQKRWQGIGGFREQIMYNNMIWGPTLVETFLLTYQDEVQEEPKDENEPHFISLDFLDEDRDKEGFSPEDKLKWT